MHLVLFIITTVIIKQNESVYGIQVDINVVFELLLLISIGFLMVMHMHKIKSNIGSPPFSFTNKKELDNIAISMIIPSVKSIFCMASVSKMIMLIIFILIILPELDLRLPIPIYTYIVSIFYPFMLLRYIKGISQWKNEEIHFSNDQLFIPIIGYFGKDTLKIKGNEFTAFDVIYLKEKSKKILKRKILIY